MRDEVAARMFEKMQFILKPFGFRGKLRRGPLQECSYVIEWIVRIDESGGLLQKTTSIGGDMLDPRKDSDWIMHILVSELLTDLIIRRSQKFEDMRTAQEVSAKMTALTGKDCKVGVATIQGG